MDAVLIIGEHGDYPNNEFGQKEYPRYRFFKDVVEVFKKDGKTTPIFNDKHLSWKWGMGQGRWPKPRGRWAFRSWPGRRCR